MISYLAAPFQLVVDSLVLSHGDTSISAELVLSHGITRRNEFKSMQLAMDACHTRTLSSSQNTPYRTLVHV
jgi:hypothetical protein